MVLGACSIRFDVQSRDVSLELMRKRGEKQAKRGVWDVPENYY